MRGTTYAIFLFLLLVIAFNMWLFPGIARLHNATTIFSELPDLKFFYNPTELCLLFEDWSSNGRQAYKWILVVDSIYPFVYASLIYLILKKLFSKTYNKILFLTPWLAAMFDWMENLSTGYWLIRFPECPEKWMVFIPLSTSLKWFFLTLSFIWIIIGVVKLLRNRLFKL